MARAWCRCWTSPPATRPCTAPTASSWRSRSRGTGATTLRSTGWRQLATPGAERRDPAPPPGYPRAPARPAADGHDARFRAALLALDRPAPQGRATQRTLHPDHRSRQGGAGDPRIGLRLLDPQDRPGPRRSRGPWRGRAPRHPPAPAGEAGPDAPAAAAPPARGDPEAVRGTVLVS